MKTVLDVNLTNRTARQGGSEWTPPVITFGESLTLAMRFERETEGELMPLSLVVNSLWAAVGEIDERPKTGTFAIQIGDEPGSEDNTTADLPAGSSASVMQAAIAALPLVVSRYGAPKVETEEGSWLLRFGSGSEPVPLKVVHNRLSPIAFGKVRGSQIDEEWVQEIRLTVAPVAFTDLSERVLPEPPSIRRIQAGGSEGEFFWNEIQELYLPPEFRGTYQFRRDYRRTGLLSRSDGPEEIAAALSVLDPGFQVTNPMAHRANIEFGGEMKGVPHDLLEVLVFNAPEGDLTFTILFDRDELWKRFRSAREIVLPLEVKMVIEEGGRQRTITAFRQELTIRNELIFSELALVHQHDWLRPPSPKDYVPRDPSTIIHGQQHWPFVLGTGDQAEIVVDHELDTRDLSGIQLWDRVTGDLLVMGTHYTVRIVDDHSVRFTFPEPPDVDSLEGVLTSAGPRSAFIDGLQINIPQVNHLETALEAIGERLSTLETILPSTGLATGAESEKAFTIVIPARDEILFYDPETGDMPSGGRYLLPAIHQDTPYAALPAPVPKAEDLEPGVYEYTGESPLALRIGGGVRDRLRPSVVTPGGYVGCDGRSLYPLTQALETKSFYASIFDRELFWFAVSDRQHRVGRTMLMEFAITLQLLKATSAASWVLELRTGTAPQDTAPSPTGLNLQNVVWSPTPILQRRLVLNELEMKHQFGLRMSRTAGGLNLDVSEYGVWEGLNSAAPPDASYLIQGRLIQFDTENSKPEARGFVRHALTGKETDDIKITIS